MRRFIVYTIIYIAGLVIQFAFSKYADIFGVFPNILLLVLLYIGLTRGSFAGQILGFLWGLSWDIMSVGLFGSHSLVFTLIGYFSGKLARKWDESKIATQMIIAGFASVIFWVLLDLTRIIFGEPGTAMRFDYISLFQIPYNMILVPVIFYFGKYFSLFLPDKDRYSSSYNE